MLELNEQRGRAAQRAVCSADCLQPTPSLSCRALWLVPSLSSCAWAPPSSLLFFPLFLQRLSLFSQTQRWPEQTASHARTGWADDYHYIANMHISSIYTITHTLGSIQLSHATLVKLQWLTRARRHDRRQLRLTGLSIMHEVNEPFCPGNTWIAVGTLRTLRSTSYQFYRRGHRWHTRAGYHRRGGHTSSRCISRTKAGVAVYPFEGSSPESRVSWP